MELTVRDVPEMFSEMMIMMRMRGQLEDSRNGPVLTLPEPLTVTVRQPKIRANVDPLRHANPFFHLMEFVWMMAGSRDPTWISQYNKRFIEYADDHNDTGFPMIHGAYGYRWRKYFHRDQIVWGVDMLKEDPTTRRVVLGMWDTNGDLGTDHNDLPCNTHIYLRIINGELDFTVCNRSNDVIWGMTGANAVHMTMLQELMANAIGCDVGVYRVFTNNAHVYTDLPGVDELLQTTGAHYVNYVDWDHVKPLQPNESIGIFMQECQAFMEGDFVASEWLTKVAGPVQQLWGHRDIQRNTIQDSEWHQACNLWLQWKQ